MHAFRLAGLPPFGSLRPEAKLRILGHGDKCCAMKLIPVEVEAELAGEGDEPPRRFFWEGRWLGVGQVVDRWYQGPGNPEWPMADYFKVMGSDSREYLLKRDLE